MKILFLSPLSELGGAERCLLDVLASIGESYPDVERHLVVGAPGPLVKEAGLLGVQVNVVPMPKVFAMVGDSAPDSSSIGRSILAAIAVSAGGLGAIMYARRIRGLVRAIAPDVVHSNGIKSHVVAVMVSGSIPVVWHVRDLIGRRRLVAMILRLLSGRATAAIAISRLVESDATAVLGSVPIHLIYDAIDTDAFSPGLGDSDRLDRLAGFAPTAGAVVRVGLIATYARWKGQEVFLEAIRQVPLSSGPTVRYFIVGGPIYETHGSQYTLAELRDIAATLGISDRIGFVPFQNDVVEVFRALDIVVHASTMPEPFGRTIAEAMACGRAVIMTDATGAGELADGTSAELLPAGDPAGLADAIRRLVEDGDARSTLASRSRIVALCRYSRERLGEAMMDMFSDVAAKR